MRPTFNQLEPKLESLCYCLQIKDKSDTNSTHSVKGQSTNKYLG